MLVYKNWWTEQWCCRWSRCSHDLTQRHGQPPPKLHAQVLRGSVLVLAPVAHQDIPYSSGTGLLLLPAAVPPSSHCRSEQPRGGQKSHSGKHQWRCLESKRQRNKDACREQTHKWEITWKRLGRESLTVIWRGCWQASGLQRRWC